MNEMVEFAIAWTSLGSAIQEQVKDVLAEGPEADCNPNAIKIAIRKFKDLYIDDIEEIIDALQEWQDERESVASCIDAE